MNQTMRCIIMNKYWKQPKVWCPKCNGRVWAADSFDCNPCCNNTVFMEGWGVLNRKDLDNLVNT